MEPLTTAAIAIGTIIATKALEKTTEKVTESLVDKTGKFLVTLKKHSPHTVAAIEKAQTKEGQIISLASVPNDKVILIFVGIGKFYKGQGLYKLAESWHERCINVCQALFDGDHPDVASSLMATIPIWSLA
jgi:hypothetical protein